MRKVRPPGTIQFGRCKVCNTSLVEPGPGPSTSKIFVGVSELLQC